MPRSACECMWQAAELQSSLNSDVVNCTARSRTTGAEASAAPLSVPAWAVCPTYFSSGLAASFDHVQMHTPMREVFGCMPCRILNICGTLASSWSKSSIFKNQTKISNPMLQTSDYALHQSQIGGHRMHVMLKSRHFFARPNILKKATPTPTLNRLVTISSAEFSTWVRAERVKDMAPRAAFCSVVDFRRWTPRFEQPQCAGCKDLFRR